MVVGEVYSPLRGGMEVGGASGLRPTLRKCAKDGAPEVLRLVKGGPPARFVESV